MSAVIPKTSWLTRCKNCWPTGGGGGGGSDLPWWLIPLTIISLFGFPALVWMSGATADRGLSATAGSCGWDAQRGVYRAAISVSNATTLAQDTTWSVQFRLQPQPGQQWPDHSAQLYYEASSQTVDVALEPQQANVAAEAVAPIPVENFACTARVQLARHRALSS